MTLQNLLEEVNHLSGTDKWRMVRHLLDSLEKETDDSPQEDWKSFVERMYGVLADDPIERPSQLPLTKRDPID